MAMDFDVVVRGAGPAGYVAAIRCAQLGLKTACVDHWLNEKGKSSLGGTCLNVGCIPSKALLQSSEMFEQAKHQFKDHGIEVEGVKLNLSAMMQRKDKVVTELTQGIASLLKSNKVEFIFGTAKLLVENKLQVVNENSEKKCYSAENIIIACGSSSVELASAPLTDDLIVDSTGALSFDAVPKKIGVIGAGVIGLELGSVWRRLGSEVVILEAQDAFLPMADQQIARDAARLFKKQKLDIRLNARLLSSRLIGAAASQQVEVNYQDEKGDQKEIFDKLIVAVGRKPNTDHISDGESNLLLDERGFIHVNDHLMTNLPGIYAIGDVIPGPMLAHKGSAEGVAVAEHIAGHPHQVNYDTIPSIVYTEPEIAWTGQTEETLKQAGIKYRTGSFPFTASGRARAMRKTTGMVKIVAEEKTDEILGVYIIGAHASELIAEAVLALEMGADAEDMSLTIHPHPTLSETLCFAAEMAEGTITDLMPPRKKGR